jgi:hypothetical protein
MRAIHSPLKFIQMVENEGRKMDENDKVGNYDVFDGDEILLIPHSTAGAL